MTTTVYRKDRNTEDREGEFVKVESLSRPGLFHSVSQDFRFCSCEAGSYGAENCSHRRIARIRAAKALTVHECSACLGYGTFISYPRLCVCAVCQGTGEARSAA